MGRRRSRRQQSTGNPRPAGAPPAVVADALLEEVQKIDLASIEDERARSMIRLLLNLVEDLRGELKRAHQEIAYLRERLGLPPGGGAKSGNQTRECAFTVVAFLGERTQGAPGANQAGQAG